MKTYTAPVSLAVTLTWGATYTTVSGLPTNHGITTSSLVNLLWMTTSQQSRNGMTVHSVSANSITLTNSTGTGVTVPVGSTTLSNPMTPYVNYCEISSPAALGAIQEGVTIQFQGNAIETATVTAGGNGASYSLTLNRLDAQSQVSGCPVVLQSSVSGSISMAWNWDSAVWVASNGGTQGNSPGATSNSSPTVPGDADGIAVIPSGAAVNLNSSGGTDVRTWTGADVVGSSGSPVTVLSVAGTLHFLGAGMPQSGWATSQYQIIEITSGGYVDGPGPWSSGEFDFQGAGSWNDGTQAGTLKIDVGGVLEIINSELGGFGGGLLVINPHLIQCADTSDGTYVYEDGLGMRQQITDPYFSFQGFTGSGPWNSASVVEISQGEVSMVVGHTTGAAFVPMGIGGGTQIQDPNLFPLFAVYRNGALATDAIVALSPIDIGIHSWSLPVPSNWNVGDLVDVLSLALGNNGAACWQLHHWSGVVQGVPITVGMGAGQVQPDGTGKVPASNLPGDYLSSTEQTQLSTAAGTAAALETYMAGTGVKANNLPSDYLSSTEQTALSSAASSAESAAASAASAATSAASAASSASTAATQATTAAGNTSGLSSSLSSMASSLSTIAGYAAKWTGITSLAKWLGLIMGSGADATTLAEVQANAPAAASYNNATMSEQSIAASLGNIVGPGGGFVCTVQTNDTNNDPVPGVMVYASSDSAGRTLVGGPVTSDSGGAATITLQSGAQYLWQLTSGYATPAPTQVNVTAAATFTLNSLAPFVAPSSSVYAQRSDLENIFGVPNIIKWAVLSQNDPDSLAGQAEITNRINWAIGVATADFENAMRQGRYSLPIAGPGASVWATTVVATLAGLLLYQHLKPTQRDQDGRPIPDRYDGIFTWAEQQMNFVRSGKLRLDAAVFDKGTNAPFVTHERSRGAYGPGMEGYGTGRIPPPGPFVG